MQFSPKNLGDEFKHVIDWMAQNKFGQDIKNSLKAYQRQTNDLSSNADAESALRLLLYTKVTNGLAREMRPSTKGEFDSAVNYFLAKHNQNLRTSQAMTELGALIEKYHIFGITEEKANDWVAKLLRNYQTLRDFTQDQYKLRKQGKKALLGDKGIDHYLRDFGFFDIAPIDLHEKRFIIRTGIFHAFSTQGKQDPLDYDSLQDALTTFCLFHLKGKIFQGIDLGSAPGIVDLFIWFYSADKKYERCGSTPNCAECNLNDVCLYYSTSIKRSVSLGQTMPDYGLDSAAVRQLVQQTQGVRPGRAERSNWAPIRQWAKNDLNGLVQSLRQYGMNRGAARAFLRKAGVKPHDIDTYYP